MEGQAQQPISGVPSGAPEHGPLAISPVLACSWRLVVCIDAREPIDNPMLTGADIADGSPAVQHCRVFRPLEGDVVAHRASHFD